jgi:hypothetical protein
MAAERDTLSLRVKNAEGQAALAQHQLQDLQALHSDTLRELEASQGLVDHAVKEVDALRAQVLEARTPWRGARGARGQLPQLTGPRGLCTPTRSPVRTFQRCSRPSPPPHTPHPPTLPSRTSSLSVVMA